MQEKQTYFPLKVVNISWSPESTEEPSEKFAFLLLRLNVH